MLTALACLLVASPASSELLGLFEGATCEALGKEPGTCQLLTDCYNPGDFKKNQPPICSFRGKVPVICCPDSLGLTEDDFRVGQTSKALNYCRNYSSICERQRELAGSAVVVDGRNERPYDHTYMAIIGYGDESNKVWNCGGSMISNKFILSAASCSEQFLLGHARWARLGGLEILFSSFVEEKKAVDWVIAERINHPDYTPPAVYNDIALFRLQVQVPFDIWLGPVCLNRLREIPTREVSATTWGREDESQATHSLLENNFTIFKDEDCQRLMDDRSKFPKSVDSQLMFCAGVKKARAGKCSIETGGGPLLIGQKGQCLKTQIGVASYRKRSCEEPGYPTVYTRVSHYLRWIEDIAFRN